jgi:hypothetical protein
MPTPSLAPKVLTRLEQQAQRMMEQQPSLQVLQQRLLEQGGQTVYFASVEPDLEVILARGACYQGPVRLWNGEVRRCHQNVAHLWRKHRAWSRIATGYALDESGIWLSHSWLIDTMGEPPVIETTELRLTYFGAILTEDEAEVFSITHF